MPKRMLRYAIPVDDTEHQIILNGEIRAVASGRILDSIEFWAENDSPIGIPRTFQVFGTGQEIPGNFHWRGTTERDAGFVWHLYERR